MRVLILGATGALGRPLVPLLAAAGHQVIAVGGRRRPEPTPDGDVTTAVVDLLDPDAVRRMMQQHGPDAVVHLATAIPPELDPRKIGRQFATTNRLRTDGTRNLVAAAREVGMPSLITQGLAFAYEPGDTVRSEDEPLWTSPPASFAPVVAALAELERLTREAGGTVLRLGHLHGPGTAYADDGAMARQVRARTLPIVGAGAARYSFVHVDDVASAVLAALDRPVTGALNIVDDEPVLVREWLPWFAETLGARRPLRVPAWLARLAVGPFGVAYMNELAGASNAKARAELGWRPRFTRFTDGVPAH